MVHSFEHILDSDREHGSGANLNLEHCSDYNKSEFFEKFNRSHAYENEVYTDNPQFFPKPILQSTDNVYYGHQQFAPEELAKSICSDRSDKRNFWSGWQDLKTESSVALKALKDNCAKEGHALMLGALKGYFDGQPYEDFGNKLGWSHIQHQLDGDWREVPYYRREELKGSKPNATDWGLRRVSYCCSSCLRKLSLKRIRTMDDFIKHWNHCILFETKGIYEVNLETRKFRAGNHLYRVYLHPKTCPYPSSPVVTRFAEQPPGRGPPSDPDFTDTYVIQLTKLEVESMVVEPVKDLIERIQVMSTMGVFRFIRRLMV